MKRCSRCGQPEPTIKTGSYQEMCLAGFRILPNGSKICTGCHKESMLEKLFALSTTGRSA